MRILRACFFALGLPAVVAALCLLAPRHIEAQEMGNIDGTWEGDLSLIHGPGLQARNYPPQRWRFVIQGDAARAFIVRDGKVQEIKPGKFRTQRNLTNAVMSVVDSGKDSDGTWIETEAFVILQKAPNVLGVTFAGAVNNTALPLDRDISKFLTVRTGEFRRAN